METDEILKKILQEERENGERLHGILRELRSVICKLDKLIELESSERVAKAARFKVVLTDTIQTGDKMATKAKLQAGIDFQIFENGSAVATATAVDANGAATTLPTGTSVPAWVASDPSIALSPAADGMSTLVQPGSTPLTAATVSVSATEADGTTVLTGTSDPFDVVAQPPGAAVAFKIALS